MRDETAATSRTAHEVEIADIAFYDLGIAGEAIEVRASARRKIVENANGEALR